jgi:hypothetical protein
VTPTPSNTATIAAPQFVSANSLDLLTACTNIELTWGANGTWVTIPGFGPSWYEARRNANQTPAATPVATLTADYPNDVTWGTGDSLLIGQVVKYEINGLFLGPLSSTPLTLHFECKISGLTEVTATPTP